VFLTHLANTTPDETIIKNAAEAMEKLLEAMGVPIKQIHV
jgi:phosphoribosyl 1,2-cyclic phosphodiesterase